MEDDAQERQNSGKEGLVQQWRYAARLDKEESWRIVLGDDCRNVEELEMRKLPHQCSGRKAAKLEMFVGYSAIVGGWLKLTTLLKTEAKMNTGSMLLLSRGKATTCDAVSASLGR